MVRLIYTAYSGLSDSMISQQVIASNMANAQTIGFRAEMLNHQATTLKGPSIEARAMTQGEARGANMKQGAVIETGNPLDIALSGRTMLAVQGEDGEEVYTRRGDLSVDASGVMSNGDGRPVIGDAGPVTVPPGARITIAPDGSVLATTGENPDQPPQVVGRIKLVGTAGSRIEKGLDGLFRVFGGGALPQDEEAKVTSGALEQSNVDATHVLVEMIEAQRLFDMRTKLVATARELDEGSASLMRLG